MDTSRAEIEREARELLAKWNVLEEEYGGCSHSEVSHDDCPECLMASTQALLRALAEGKRPQKDNTESLLGTMASSAAERPPSTPSESVACIDCGIPYSSFPLDTHVPRSQWLAINPDEHGILCVQCILKRAAKRLDGVTVAHVIFEVSR